MTKGGWVYLMANRPRGVLYVGVTADLAARVLAHREGRGSAFAAKWRCRTLVWVEWHDEIVVAIAREKTVKRWRRDWKIALVEVGNLEWVDLLDVSCGSVRG
ncbi:GIY-YIG nuclease family protein [Sandaracinobacteroides hominis]|uniref:GIY-YIG nuclease family protein n=1 Tax=Sandaracinobacteroides hominis TaxID=2780086 RepID=UPI0018F53DD3|nr:GIY-YIG nuclease family protein [Sandaracinobacteroides hominis]